MVAQGQEAGNRKKVSEIANIFASSILTLKGKRRFRILVCDFDFLQFDYWIKS
jgi:hypothetical protein